jgi:hypothetical protein
MGQYQGKNHRYPGREGEKPRLLAAFDDPGSIPVVPDKETKRANPAASAANK